MKKKLLMAVCLLVFILSYSSLSFSQWAFNDENSLEGKIDELVHMLKYGNERRLYAPSKQDAAIALGLLKAKSAVNDLIEALKSANSESLKIEIIRSLGWIGDKKAAAPVIDILRNDNYSQTRSVAALALGDIGGGEKTVKALKDAYKDDESEYVRRGAAQSLEKLTGQVYQSKEEIIRGVLGGLLNQIGEGSKTHQQEEEEDKAHRTTN